jgi:hypothetical protein
MKYLKSLIRKITSRRRVDSTRTILQIMPATGWLAAYVYGAGSEIAITEHPLLAWVLVEEPDGSFQVVGIDSAGHLCDEWTNLLGYYHETESTNWSDSAKQAATGVDKIPRHWKSALTRRLEHDKSIRKSTRGVWESLIRDKKSDKLT